MADAYSSYPGAAEVGATPSSAEVLRQRDIPWDIYMTARLITEHNHGLIRRYDKKDPAYQHKLLEENGPAYFVAFLSVLKSISKDEPVQYVLALLDDALSRDGSLARLFHEASTASSVAGGQPVDAPQVLLRLLSRPDWFSQEKAALLLSAALLARPKTSRDEPPPAAADQLLAWLAGQLRRPAHPSRAVPAAAHCLALLLREPAARPRAERAGLAPLLAALLRYPKGGLDDGSGAGAPADGSVGAPPRPAPRSLDVQLLYEATLAAWELSWHEPSLVALATPAALAGLVDAVRLAPKEKLVRVSLLALQRLLAASEQALEYAAVDRGLGKVLEVRASLPYDDPDIPALMESLRDRLRDGVKELSGLERYRREVASGRLSWTPAHRDEAFWTQNANEFAEADAALLRQLLALLEGSRDSLTLAVACSDVAHFVSASPHGRGMVSQLGGKSAVLRLMAHPDPAVQREALQAAQKILLSKDKADQLAGGKAPKEAVAAA